MAKSDELWNKLLQHRGEAPRDLTVEYVKAVVNEARQFSVQELTSVGSTRSMSLGETIASKLISGLAQQDWLNEESDPQLSDILSIAGQIDMYANDEILWADLFKKADMLK